LHFQIIGCTFVVVILKNKVVRTISDIAYIQTGIYAKSSSNGSLFYIQARHFDNNHRFKQEVKPELLQNEKLQKHILQKGDVLVAAKGYDNFAVTYSDIPKPACASSMFIVLRIINVDQILPGYLAWFINHPKTQRILSGNSKGTSLPSITKDSVAKLEIIIPSIHKQQSVLKVHALFQKERELKLKIDVLVKLKIQAQILNAIAEKS